MSSGAVIFDLNASSLSTVAEKVVDELLNKNEIRASDRDDLLRALLMKRRSPTRNNMSMFLLQDDIATKSDSLHVHFICPSSQSEGTVVTPSGDIQMQTFSVTKKVCILFITVLSIFIIWVIINIIFMDQLKSFHLLNCCTCCFCRETVLTTWRPRLSSQVCSCNSRPVMCLRGFVCGSRADDKIKVSF